MTSSPPDTPSRDWARVEALFFEALNRAPDAPRTWLRSQQQVDAGLRSKVDALLAAHEEAGDLFESAIGVAAHDSFASAGASVLSQRIGAYTLIRELGHGGMGSVYLAERADEQFSHQVAIKLVQQQLPSPYLIERFKAERQILARLAHPNIARLLDGGATAQGSPYIVMEYIEGTPVDRYCDDQQLSLRGRLALFRKVCDAVHYAHQRLVVHRDLKPANILITVDGEPKLLDFGIAKLLQEDMAGTPELTLTGASLLTPAYASPEQIRGDPVTVASDVYALGVLLYRLLSGQAPYALDSCRPAEVEQLICRTQPPRPSQQVIDGPVTGSPGTERWAAQRLRRSLQGELDNIVLMALRKEPERRYGSVQALAEDLDNYVAGRPVAAQPDTFAYRCGKFVRRNRLAVAATATVVLLSAGFAVISAVQAQRIAAQRDAAQLARSAAVQEQRRAEVVSRFLVELFTSNDPEQAQGRDITVRELLDAGASRVRRELADQPALAARLLDTMGGVYLSLGLGEQAEPLLRDANALLDTSNAPATPALAANVLHLGELAYARDELEKARALFERAGELHLAVHGDPSEKTARALDQLGNVLRSGGDYRAAEVHYRRALHMRQTAPDRSPGSAAHSQHNLAATLNALGQYDEAEVLAREAIASHETTYGPVDSRTLNTKLVLANIIENRGDGTQAVSLMREVLAGQRQIFGAQHPVVHNSLNSLGTALLEAGDVEAGERVLREALAVGEALYGENNRAAAFMLNNLAWGIENAGRVEEAEELYRRSLAVRMEIFGAQSGRVASAYSNLAGNLVRQERLDEAAAFARRAMAIALDLHGDDSEDVANIRMKLGVIELRQGRPAEAADILQDSLRFYRQALPDDHHYVSLLRLYLARALVQLERYEDAEPLLLAAHGAWADQAGGEEGQRAAAQVLVQVYEGLEQPGRAAKWRPAP